MAAETAGNNDSSGGLEKKDDIRIPEFVWVQPGVPTGYHEVEPRQSFPANTHELFNFIDFRKAKVRGITNPTPIWNTFWIGQIGPTRVDLPTARKALSESLSEWPRADPELAEPIWSFDRRGQTCTRLPDGRLVFIGGEYGKIHEVDFCIYNDVVILKAPQKTDPPPHFSPEDVMIYGYPIEEFPPIDRHTATYYVNPATSEQMLIIIGGLGYPERVLLNRTDVYKLELHKFHIQRMETSGTGPTGLTYLHSAFLGFEDGQAVIKIRTMPKTYKVGLNSELPFGVATREFVAEMVATDFFAGGLEDVETPMTDDQKTFTLRISDMRWI